MRNEPRSVLIRYSLIDLDYASNTVFDIEKSDYNFKSDIKRALSRWPLVGHKKPADAGHILLQPVFYGGIAFISDGSMRGLPG